MLRKIFMLAAVLAAALYSGSASAEQAAAETYRQMFRAGNFYVEYQVNRDAERSIQSFETANIIAAKNNSRIVKHYAAGQSKKDEQLDALYQNGKYYQFAADKSSTISNRKTSNEGKVLPESRLNSPELNPEEDWGAVKAALNLPEELAIFCWDDKFRDNPLNLSAPIYRGSNRKTVNDKEYDCDQYVRDIKSLAGTTIAQEIYNFLYENGNLVMTQKYFLRDGKETLLKQTSIITLTAQVPDSAFKINKEIKIYEAGNGDMKDMLEQYALVETLGGK